MCGGGSDYDQAAADRAAKAEANKLKYEKDLEEWEQNRKVQTDKRGQAAKDSMDRRASRSLLSKAGGWGRGVAKSFIGTEAIPELEGATKSLLGSATKADGTVIEDDPLLRKTVIKK